MSIARVISRRVSKGRGLVFNAILQKELRSSGRRKATYLIRGGYAAFFSLVTLIAVGTLLPSFEFESPTARAQMLTSFARSLVLFVTWFQFLTIALISPAITSPTICEEKQLGTLSALMTTPLSSLQIVLGKLAGRLYQVLILILISAPILLAVRVFGGVPAETIVAFTCVTLATAVLGGTMGLLFSMWHSRAAGAAIFALLTLGLLFMAPPMIYFAMKQTNYFGLSGLFGISDQSVSVLAPIGYAASPPITLIALSENGPTTLGYGWLVGTPLDRIWVASVVILLGMSGFLVLVASALLRRLMQREAGGGAAPDEKEETEQIANRRRRRLVRLGARPIYWREVSRPWIENRFQLGVLVFVLVTTLGYAYWRTDLTEEPMHLIMGLAGLGVIVLLASVQTTGAINGERDAQTWDVLMTAPVSGWRVLLEKYLASVVRLWPLLAFVSAHFVYSAIAGYITWMGAAMVIMLVTSPPTLYLATGLFLSMVFRKGVVASIANICLILAVWAGLPILVVLWSELRGHSSYSSNDTAELVLHVTSPLGLMGSIIDDDVAGTWHGRRGTFQLGDDRIARSTMLLVVAAVSAMHVLLAAGVLKLAHGLFVRCSGRTS